jgi:hypothetical protein
LCPPKTLRCGRASIGKRGGRRIVFTAAVAPPKTTKAKTVKAAVTVMETKTETKTKATATMTTTTATGRPLGTRPFTQSAFI